MTTKMWSKKAGEVWTRDGRALFSAMPGTRGYLVSFHDDLLTPEPEPEPEPEPDFAGWRAEVRWRRHYDRDELDLY